MIAVTQLTLNEKLDLLRNSWPGLPRFDIAPFAFGGECLHGLCHTGRATVFPLPIAMAATFDPATVQAAARAIALEARAKFFSPDWPASSFISLAYWTPNINLFRDPRWGRGQETFGEDPCLTGDMGAAFVRGLQGEAPGQLLVAACAKHLAVHSGPEAHRTAFNAEISPKLLHETYLPHFKKLVDAGVAVVMGAYNALNGEPCCGSPALLNGILRKDWGFDGMVVSDAGAIAAFHRGNRDETDADSTDTQWAFLARQMKELPGHAVTRDAAESAALALRSGCDMSLGDDLAPDTVREALERGLIDEADIDQAANRVLRLAEKLDVLRPVRHPAPGEPGTEILQCAEHLALSRRLARNSMVLLKNNGILPLGTDIRRIAVSGPAAADINVLLGNFYRGVSGSLVTLLEGVVRHAPDGVVVTHLQGCDWVHPHLHDSTWAIGLAENADVAVAMVGNTPLMEGEHGECIASALGGDRDRMTLPEVQLDYLHRLKTQSGKPLVLVVTGGSPIIMPEAMELADAVLLAWYPGEQGGEALGELLFGKASPCGHLPFTIPAHPDHVPPFEDYSMKGRTYRYPGDHAPAFPFGFGLGYSTFAYGTPSFLPDPAGGGTLSARITNTGNGRAETLAQVYVRIPEDRDGPWCNLVACRTVDLAPGESKSVAFDLTAEYFTFFDEAGRSVPARETAQIWIAPHTPSPHNPLTILSVHIQPGVPT